MRLLDLPTELLDQIFEDVGSRFFRRDLRRLSISKLWHTHAQRIVTRNLWISSAMLEYLFRGRDEEPILARRVAALHKLRIHLHGLYADPTPAFYAASGSLAGEQSLWHTAPWLAWRDDARQQLLAFCQMLSYHCLQLTSLWLFAEHELEPSGYGSALPTPYLGIGAIYTLLRGLSTLTVLELDLNDSGDWTSTIRSFGEEEAHHAGSEQNHLCASIGALLKQLVRLRLRMEPICSAALGHAGNAINPNLKEITINLSLQVHMHGTIQSRSLARKCEKDEDGPFSTVNPLIQRMQRLRETLENPEHLRVLYHLETGHNVFKLRAYDAMDPMPLHVSPASSCTWLTPSIGATTQEIIQSPSSEAGFDTYIKDEYFLYGPDSVLETFEG